MYGWQVLGALKHKEKIAATSSALLNWFAQEARDLPWRRTRDPYAVWVSEIMLQQTQVKTVIPYWERWMGELPTIQALADAPEGKIHKLWEGLGYYTRVRNMQKAARVIVAEHGGRFPEKFEEVLELPGIGRYTAGAICSIAFNQSTPLLDGNVIRVLTRVFGIGENPKDKVTNERLWRLAGELVEVAGRGELKSKSPHPQPLSHPMGEGGLGQRSSKEGGGLKACFDNRNNGETLIPSLGSRCSHLNQSLMELGALICTPRQPKCLVCPVAKLCVALKEGRVAELPNLGERVAATERRFVAFVCERDGQFLVRQRPAGVVNAYLWEFPNVEIENGNADLMALATKVLGAAVKSLEPLGVVKHSITRYRITLEAYRVEVRGRLAKGAGGWLGGRELSGLAFTSAHKKILGRTGRKADR